MILFLDKSNIKCTIVIARWISNCITYMKSASNIQHRIIGRSGVL